MPTFTPIEGDPFDAASSEPETNASASLGIVGSSLSGPLGLTRQMGQNANWDKFSAEQRPSTNVEDDRNRSKSLKEIINNAISDGTNSADNLLFK